MSCGAKDLESFLGVAGKNVLYTSRGSTVEFIEAINIWVEETLLKRLQSKSYYIIMVDECTDISTTVEELSLFCCWEENGLPE